jgi:hypothetical protein
MKLLIDLVGNLLIFGGGGGIAWYFYNKWKADKEAKELQLAAAQSLREDWENYDDLVIDNKTLGKMQELNPDSPCFFITYSLLTNKFTDDKGRPSKLDITGLVENMEKKHEKAIANAASGKNNKKKGLFPPTTGSKGKPKMAGPNRNDIIQFLRKNFELMKVAGIKFTKLSEDDEEEDDLPTVEMVFNKYNEAGGLVLVLRKNHIAVIAWAQHNTWVEATTGGFMSLKHETDKIIVIKGLKVKEKEEPKAPKEEPEEPVT